MESLRAKIRIYNNALVQRREEAGLSRLQLAKLASVSVGIVCQYETIRNNPRTHFGDWKETAKSIAFALGALPEEVWPPIVEQVKNPVVTRALPEEQLAIWGGCEMERLELPSPDSAVELLELGEDVECAIAKLPRREEAAIRRRFGIGRPSQTYGEIAKDWGVTGQRIRQIEARAFKRMRGSSMSKLLRGHIIDAEQGEG